MTLSRTTPQKSPSVPGRNFQPLALGSLLLVSTIVLFLGFYRNEWRVVREKKFKQFQLDSESLVIARMVQSRQAGMLSENGLLGWGDANPLDLNESDYAHQYEVYLSGGTFQSYALYKSVSGFQAMLLGALDGLSPSSPAANLRNFRGLMALLLAVTLSIFVLWAKLEFDWPTALVALVSTVLSQWITLYGHNLFYFISASFLPLAGMLMYLRWEQKNASLSDLRLALIGFGTILFKCLMNGYDFIIPALSMAAIPLVYHGLRDGWHARKFFKRLTILGVALAAATVISILVLGLQLETSEGGFGPGLASVFSTFSRRTYADPSMFPLYAESLTANPWSVLWTYMADDSAIDLLGLRFLDMIGILAAVTVLFGVVDRFVPPEPPHRTKARALIATTWLSILSPVSWFLIFKGQAYVHIHTNYLAWHMPFMLFAYVTFGFIASSARMAMWPPRERPRPA